ncbi:hypothetical protein SteCoe_15269 [Stentor coeruleus]|uniref:EF-hand domain-containing protein n=1 Tax=Stentor coeruleus TaxID=5963 RepID=A0A1R2C407_9CILI|nr:hypothetical protein SteCoe_15269 [Stentor coeruleus]
MANRSLAEAVIAEINLCRSNPGKYSDKLSATLKFYNGNVFEKPGATPIETEEGPENVQECIQQLKSTSSLPTMKWSDALASAAQVHIDDIGPKGAMGHTGTDGSDPGERIERFGQWEGTIGENIDYGNTTAEDIVVSLLIDDGVTTRGHRTNILKAEHLFSGCAYGDHSDMEHVCVVVFAQGISDSGKATTPAEAVKPPQKSSSPAPAQRKEEPKPAVQKKEEPKPTPKKEEPKPAPKKEEPKGKQPAKPVPKPAVVQKKAPAGPFDPKDYVKPGINADEIQEIKEAFDLFDSDGSGTVEPGELKNAMVSLGFEAKNATLFHMINDLDKDGSGAIDFDEFLDMMTSTMTEADSKEDIKKIFNLFDTEKTGTVTIKSLRKIIADLGEALTEDDMLDLIKKGDSNGDGQVTFDDFYNIMTKRF